MNNFDLIKYLAEGKLSEELGPKGESTTFSVDYKGEPYTIEWYKQDQGYAKDRGERSVYAIHQVYTPEGDVVDWDTETYEKFMDMFASQYPEFTGSDLAEPSIEENKIKEIKSNKMKKSELKEMIKAAMLEGDNYYEDSMKSEEMRKDDMDEEMRKDDMDEEMSQDDNEFLQFTDMDQAAATEAKYYEDKVDEAEEVDVEDNEDIDVDIEKDVKIDDEESEVDIDVKASMPGENEDVEEVQALLMKAQQAAADLGDDKLMDQIGNTITYFTRSQVARVDEMDDLDINLNTTEEEAEMGLEEEKQGYDDKLDDAEGAKHGKKKQDMKQRRADSENMEKADGKRKFAGDSKMDKKNENLNESMFPMWNKIK